METMVWDVGKKALKGAKRHRWPEGNGEDHLRD